MEIRMELKKLFVYKKTLKEKQKQKTEKTSRKEVLELCTQVQPCK